MGGEYLPGVLREMVVPSLRSGLLVLLVHDHFIHYHESTSILVRQVSPLEKKKKVNNLGTEFCIFWYCHERILCIWQAFILSRRNSFFSSPPEQDANLKGKEHWQEILAIWEKRQRPSALPLQET